MRPYVSLKVLIGLKRPNGFFVFLCVLMNSSGSLCFVISRYAFLLVLMDPY